MIIEMQITPKNISFLHLNNGPARFTTIRNCHALMKGFFFGHKVQILSYKIFEHYFLGINQSFQKNILCIIDINRRDLAIQKLSPKGKLIGKIKTYLIDNKLIEKFMLSANICAADFLNRNYSQGIYRVHDYPENYKIDRLSQILKRRNINWEGSIEDVENLNIFIKNLSKRSDKSILNAVVLQSMQRAEYSTKEIGHFGLKYKKYTHFTSPIRRYPDLIVHRMIIAKLNKLNYEIEDLEDLLVH